MDEVNLSIDYRSQQYLTWHSFCRKCQGFLAGVLSMAKSRWCKSLGNLSPTALPLSEPTFAIIWVDPRKDSLAQICIHPHLPFWWHGSHPISVHLFFQHLFPFFSYFSFIVNSLTSTELDLNKESQEDEWPTKDHANVIFMLFILNFRWQKQRAGPAKSPTEFCRCVCHCTVLPYELWLQLQTLKSIGSEVDVC